MCLNKRDRRQLETNLWRAKKVLLRNKSMVLKVFLFPASILASAIFSLSQIKILPLSCDSVSQYSVASSDPQYNYFISNTTDAVNSVVFETPLELKNCTAYNSKQVAIIENTESTPEAELGNTDLMEIADQIMTAYQNLTGISMHKKFYNDNKHLDNFVGSQEYTDDPICFAIGWNTYLPTSKTYDIDIRVDYSQAVPTGTDQVQNQMAEYSVQNLDKLNSTGFLEIMAVATDVIIQKSRNKTSDPYRFALMYTPMNTGEFSDNTIANLTVSMFVPLILYLWANIGLRLYDLTKEDHEEKIQWILKRLGMREGVNIMLKSMIYMISMLFIGTPVLLYFNFTLFTNVNTPFFLIYMWIVASQFLMIDFVLQYSFNGTLRSILQTAYYGTQAVLAVFAAFNPTITTTQFYLNAIFAFTQAGNFCKLAMIAQNTEKTIDFGNIGQPIIEGTSINMETNSIIVFVVFSIHIIIIAYIWPYKIAPDPDQPLRWYYPCICACLRKRTKIEYSENQFTLDEEEPLADAQPPLLTHKQSEQDIERNQLLQEEERVLVDRGMMENLSGNESADRLIIKQLVKKYGKKVAVNNLTLTLFKNQILVLLGHNGAGKTTTISMLIGQEKPTSGSATAFGVNLFKDDRNEVDFIGVCPQEDSLFEKMTVKENLEFFCRFKGMQRIDLYIDETLEKFNLSSKSGTLAKNLSGGQKRKLQLAIALIGDSKLVLLDEPSSGMDPTARRETWEIIKEAKKDKIIILTTHYMDEAEMLADRVAIVSRGSLKTCGTSFFLKQKYGMGYFFEFDCLKGSQEEAKEELKKLIQNYTDQGIEDESQSSFIGSDNFEMESNEQGKTVYKVPYSIAKKFKVLFEEIDGNKAKYGVADYSIRCSTLEEVFIKIGEEEAKLEEKEFFEQLDGTELLQEAPQREKSGCCRQFKAHIKMVCQSYWFGGNTFGLIFIFTAIFIMAGLFGSITMTDKNPPLNYSGINQIYSSIEPMTLKYNQDDDSLEIMTRIMTNYGSDTFDQESGKQDWNMTDTETYSEYFMRIGDDLASSDSSKDIAAYIVNQTNSSEAYTDINVVVFANMSSDAAFQTFGSLMLQSIAQEITGEMDLSIGYTSNTLPPNQLFITVSDTSMVGSFITQFLLCAIILNVFINSRVARNFETGFYNSVMMRGGSRMSYLFGMYVADVCHHLLVPIISKLVFLFWGFVTPGFILPTITWAFTNPIYLYFLQYTFVYARGFKGSSIIFMQGAVEGFSIIAVQQIANQAKSDPSAQHIGQIFEYAGCFMPFYNWSAALAKGWIAPTVHLRQDPDTMAEGTNPNGPYGSEFSQLALVGNFVVYLILLLFSVYGVCNKKAMYSNTLPDEVVNEDEQIKVERQRVGDQINGRSGNDEQDTLQVYNLVKQYQTPDPNPDQDRINTSTRSDRPLIEVEQGVDDNGAQQNAKKKGKKAVKGTSFGVKAGECFSLLGINGAGKTSTFNCLVGQEDISGGQVLLANHNVNRFFRKAHLLYDIVGYCPQFNCIEPHLSVKQTLALFSVLVGVLPEQVEITVMSMIIKFGLVMFTDTKAGALSGGNKRKLCLAMAMIGRPKIIYIDEASAGVDPASRRIMWKAIRSEGAESAVIITTHAMEEAEALSSKLGIMVAGKFSCFGSLHHIKNTFGQGYEIELNLDFDELIEDLPQIDQAKRYSNDEENIRDMLKDWHETIRGLDKPRAFDFNEEFSRAGLLCAFFNRVRDGQTIDIQSIQREVVLQNNVGLICSILNERASEATIAQMDGFYVHIKLQKNDKSFGYMYSLLEELKQKFSIKEYSCNLSTLEQVFNAFATEEAYATINRRLSRRNSSIQFIAGN